jgi:hypothetical protein
MIRVELAAVEIVNDVIAEADEESFPCSECLQCIDDALDEFVHAHNDDMAIGAGGCLADMIEDGMRLIGVARAEDCKNGCADGIVTQDKNFVDELVLHHGGVGVCLLEVEIGAAEGDWPTLEAWIEDVGE